MWSTSRTGHPPYIQRGTTRTTRSKETSWEACPPVKPSATETGVVRDRFWERRINGLRIFLCNPSCPERRNREETLFKWGDYTTSTETELLSEDLGLAKSPVGDPWAPAQTPGRLNAVCRRPAPLKEITHERPVKMTFRDGLLIIPKWECKEKVLVYTWVSE